jgi:demethylmenaquinone methyltransferase / 2-methoxy-6-polyprenyl-1,4-benzoquinol methylase
MVGTRDEPLKEVSSRIFAGLARSYDRVLDYATFFQDRRWKRWVIGMMDGRESDLVLDVGCGTLVLERRLGGLGYRFVGVDLSPQMVRVGRRKGARNVVLLANGDAEHLPFADGAFDIAVSCYVAKYVDLPKFAAELARVTKSGGRAVLYDFAKPKGMAAPLLEMYIQGALRAAGRLLRLASKDEALTFSELPRIIDGTTWDDRIGPEMESSGFEPLAFARLTGGAVFAYCGRKKRT